MSSDATKLLKVSAKSNGQSAANGAVLVGHLRIHHLLLARLNQIPDIDLQIIAFAPAAESFDRKLIEDLPCHLMPPEKRGDYDYVAGLIKERNPDVLYLAGWFHPPYRQVIFAKEFESVRKWIGVDTPWTGSVKQQLGKWVLPRLVRRLDRVFVPGERAWQYLRVLGAPQSKVSRGMYGVEYDALQQLHAERSQHPEGWPRKFLFAGRYAPEKGLDVLLDGYARYRSEVTDPWPLLCCGGGPLKSMLAGKEGVNDLGFQQPAQLRQRMVESGAFVLPSHFDPWPLVIVESCAAGLPVLCTEACGSAVEMVRSYFNGVPFATGSGAALANAMKWIHHRSSAELSEMGSRGRQLASAYSAQMWAQRWAEAARQSSISNSTD